MKTFAEFKEAIKDEALAKEMKAYTEEQNPQDKNAEIEAVVAFAESKGFAITVEDLSQERACNRELSDDEIENVAGGNWCWRDQSCILAYNLGFCDLVFY